MFQYQIFNGMHVNKVLVYFILLIFQLKVGHVNLNGRVEFILFLKDNRGCMSKIYSLCLIICKF